MRALVALLALPLLLVVSAPSVRADAPAGPAVRSPEVEAQAAYDDATDLRRAGRFEEAAARYEALAAAYPNSRLAPRALASAAAIWQWDLAGDGAGAAPVSESEGLASGDGSAGSARPGPEARARALYDRVIAGPADRPGVLPAIIQRLGLERDAAGPKAELALVDRWLDASPRAEWAPFLLTRSAELLEEEDLGDRVGAIARLERLLTLFPRSTRADEALMRAAKLYRAIGRPAEAAAKYRALMGTKSSSWIVGEYDSTRLDDAYFELAETERLDLHDAAAAEASYRRLVAELPNSRLVDDALHQASLLAKARGDAAQVAKDQEDLARLRPGSRFLKAAGAAR